MSTATTSTPFTFTLAYCRFWLRECVFQIAHWSALLTPQLWRRVATWRNVRRDDDDDARDDAAYKRSWRLWGSFVVPPLLLHVVNLALSGSTSGSTSTSSSGNDGSQPTFLRQVWRGNTFSSSSSRTTTYKALTATATATYLAVNSYLLWKASSVFRQTLPYVLECLFVNRSTTDLPRGYFVNLAHPRRQEGQEQAQAQAQPRAVSTYHYDLYLPPPLFDKGRKNSNHKKAILFLPGAGVGHRAFACVAHALSNQGYTVVVVNAEPLRHLFPALGYTADYLRTTCLTPVVRHYPQLQSLDDWSLVGHSMGAFCALHVAVPLKIDHVVLWAVAPFVMVMPDLSDNHHLHVAVVQGQDDAIIAWVLQHYYNLQQQQQPSSSSSRTTGGDTDWTAQFWAQLPANAREYVIAGGTHAGFGHYQSKRFPENVTCRLQQQEQAVALTHQFLSLSSSSPRN